MVHRVALQPEGRSCSPAEQICNLHQRGTNIQRAHRMRCLSLLMADTRVSSRRQGNFHGAGAQALLSRALQEACITRFAARIPHSAWQRSEDSCQASLTLNTKPKGLENARTRMNVEKWERQTDARKRCASRDGTQPLGRGQVMGSANSRPPFKLESLGPRAVMVKHRRDRIPRWTQLLLMSGVVSQQATTAMPRAQAVADCRS